jgi:hypothetical protein
LLQFFAEEIGDFDGNLHYGRSDDLTLPLIVDIDRISIAIWERGMAAGVFRPLDPFQSTINIMGTCLFYFIGAGNIQQFPQG